MLKSHSFTSLQLANSILETTIAKRIDISLLKLMKLSYITVGYCLYFDFDPISEDIEAWKWGPVIPSLWGYFREYGIDGNITKLAKDIDRETGETITPSIEIRKNETTEMASAIVYHVIEKYKKQTGWDLVEKTHKEYTPWFNVYKKNKKNIIIPKDKIQKYYKQFLKVEVV